MRRNILIFALCAFITNTAILFAQGAKPKSPEYTFYKASSLYEEGKYNQAIAEYNHLLDAGFENGDLYYNLGNCYFKNNQLGKAILSYERAKRLIPRDKDLGANYEYARSLIKGDYSTPEKIWIFRMIDSFFGQFTVDGITILLSLTYVIATLLIIATVVLKPFKVYTRSLLIILIAFFVLTSAIFYSRISLFDKEAVIIQKQADAKFEPFVRATTHFTIYEGMKVQLVISRGNWSKVKRLDRKSGWIKNTAFELI